MASVRSMLKGGLDLGGGQAVVQACSFVRSVILARLLSPQDYGVAAAFAMTLSLLDMVSNLSSDKLLIQATDGDDPRFQSTAQFVHLGRGLGNAAIVFFLAGPISRLFGIPQAEWAFRCLALLPFLRGFVHLDFNRMQREMRFRPAVGIDVVSNLLATALAFPLAIWLRSYSAMLFLLLFQAAAWSLGSHLVAERRYSWSWDRHYARRMFAFGWPLLVNGLLLYGIMQGDRVIIGSSRQLFPGGTYTLADLGVYSVAFSLTMAPTMFVANVATSLFLPVLARARQSSTDFERKYLNTFDAICLSAAMISIPLIFAGGQVLVWVYGGKYSAGGAVVGCLAAMWGLRTIRTAPTLAALAHADTKAAMISNAIRSVALIGILFAAATGANLIWVAISGLVGELLALPALMWRISRMHGVHAAPCWRPLCVLGLAMAAAIAVSPGAVASPNLFGMAFWTLMMTTLTFLTMILVSPRMRHDLRQVLVSVSAVLRTRVIAAGAPRCGNGVQL